MFNKIISSLKNDTDEKNSRFNFSMRTKSALIIIVIVTIFVFANYLSTVHFVQQSVEKTMAEELALSLDFVDQLVTTEIDLLESNADIIANALRNENDEENMRLVLYDGINKNLFFKAAAVIGQDGVIASYGGTFTQVELAKNNDAINNAFNGSTSLTSKHTKTDADEVVFSLFVPIKEMKVLCIRLDANFFTDIIQDIKSWDSGSIFIIDDEGTFVADIQPDLNESRRNYIYDAQNDPSLSEMSEFMQTIIDSRQSEVYYYTYQGEDRIAIFKVLSNQTVKWHIAVSSAIHSQPVDSVLNSTLISFVIFLLLGVIAAFFASGFTAKPYKIIEEQNQRLLDEEELTKLLLDSMPLACTLWNEKHEIIECNNEAVMLFDSGNKQNLIDNFFDFCTEYQQNGQSTKVMAEKYLTSAYNDGFLEFDWLHKKPDGTLIPCFVKLIRLQYHGEEVVAGYSRDLREQIKLMENLEQMQRRQRILMDASPIAFNLYERDGTNIYCNDEAVKLFKTKNKEEYLSLSNKLYPEYQPDGKLSSKIFHDELVSAFEKERTVREFVHQAVDGTPIPCEVTLVRVKYDDHFLVAAYLRDMSKQLEMNGELDHRDLLLNTVNKATHILLTSKDDDTFYESIMIGMELLGKCVGCDRVHIMKNEMRDGKLYFTYKYKWTNRVGEIGSSMDVGEKISYDDLPEFKDTLTNDRCIAGPVAEQNSDTRQFLSKIDIKSVLIIPIFIQDEFWGLVSLSDCKKERNFTDDEIDILRSGSIMMSNTLIRHENTIEVINANQSKSHFLANISHEMRTPLNAILGLSVLSLEHDKSEDEMQANFEKIYSSGKTLLSLVNDILDISRIESGKFELVPSEYEVPSLLNDVINQNLLRISNKPIDFILNVKEDLPEKLFGDDIRVKQIISNFLSNAFKYTNKGVVELSIDTTIENDSVILTIMISDTGIGIKEEDIGSLFTNYVQLSSGTRSVTDRIGLGLPICKNLVEMMDGLIIVESEYGKGSTFTVMIKQKLVDDDTIGPEVAEVLKRFSYSDVMYKDEITVKRIKMPYAKVLVVDDNITNLDVAKRLLGPYGMHIDTATSGQEAIDLIKNEKVEYNAVFMDHMMPGMDGVEAVRRIRNIDTDYARNLNIIALTANAIVGNEEMFLKSGFQAFLSKPIDIHELDDILRDWVMDETQEIEHWDDDIDGGANDNIFKDVEIEGLNVQQGIRRFNNNEKTYLEVLISYAKNTKSLMEKAKSVTKSNLAEYAIIVHGIKSSSRGIHADEIGMIAESLEFAAKEGDFTYIEKYNKELIDEVIRLIADIDEFRANTLSSDQRDNRERPDRDLLKKLTVACENYDIDGADDIITFLEKFNYNQDQELVEWLRENINMSNLKQIRERLSKYLE